MYRYCIPFSLDIDGIMRGRENGWGRRDQVRNSSVRKCQSDDVCLVFSSLVLRLSSQALDQCSHIHRQAKPTFEKRSESWAEGEDDG